MARKVRSAICCVVSGVPETVVATVGAPGGGIPNSARPTT
jgi:hypothetical protein